MTEKETDVKFGLRSKDPGDGTYKSREEKHGKINGSIAVWIRQDVKIPQGLCGRNGSSPSLCDRCFARIVLVRNEKSIFP